MGDIWVYISAEDPVTKAVIERLLAYCSPRLKVFKEMPARGGEIKSKIAQLNALASSKPVILLMDLDTDDCAPLLKSKLLNGISQSPNFLMSIAVDEAEAWLMADREGFANYMGLPLDIIPSASMQKMGSMKQVVEMDFRCKSSYDLTHRIIQQSSKSELKMQIAAKGKACKGAEYNTAMLPFIRNVWNIDVAMCNSDSLSRMVRRLQKLEQTM